MQISPTVYATDASLEAGVSGGGKEVDNQHPNSETSHVVLDTWNCSVGAGATKLTAPMSPF